MQERIQQKQLVVCQEWFSSDGFNAEDKGQQFTPNKALEFNLSSAWEQHDSTAFAAFFKYILTGKL